MTPLSQISADSGPIILEQGLKGGTTHTLLGKNTTVVGKLHHKICHFNNSQ